MKIKKIEPGKGSPCVPPPKKNIPPISCGCWKFRWPLVFVAVISSNLSWIVHWNDLTFGDCFCQVGSFTCPVNSVDLSTPCLLISWPELPWTLPTSQKSNQFPYFQLVFTVYSRAPVGKQVHVVLFTSSWQLPEMPSLRMCSQCIVGWNSVKMKRFQVTFARDSDVLAKFLSY